MKINLLLYILLLSISTSLYALTFSEKYGNYREDLVEKREVVAKERTIQIEENRLNNHLNGEIKKRDLMDQLREKESLIRKKIKELF